MAKLSFGKYKNISIEFVNSSYLKWLLESDWFEDQYPEDFEAVEEEWNTRNYEQSHFYQDKVHI